MVWFHVDLSMVRLCTMPYDCVISGWGHQRNYEILGHLTMVIMLTIVAVMVIMLMAIIAVTIMKILHAITNYVYYAQYDG